MLTRMVTEVLAAGAQERAVRIEERALEHDIAKGRRVIGRLLDCPADDLRARDFLMDCVCEFGLLHNDWAGFADYRGVVNISPFGVAQIPSEFVDYLLLLAHYAPSTYLEVGTLHGGTAVLAAAFLSRFNPAFRMTCVDIANHFLDFAYYQSLLPLHFACPATSAHFLGQEFDVAFIDADHSYNEALKDYLHVGRFARICALHDIRGHEYDHLNGGTVRLWTEIKTYARRSSTVLEIAHSIPDWMGIGVVIRS